MFDWLSTFTSMIKWPTASADHLFTHTSALSLETHIIHTVNSCRYNIRLHVRFWKVLLKRHYLVNQWINHCIYIALFRTPKSLYIVIVCIYVFMSVWEEGPITTLEGGEGLNQYQPYIKHSHLLGNIRLLFYKRVCVARPLRRSFTTEWTETVSVSRGEWA